MIIVTVLGLVARNPFPSVLHDASPAFLQPSAIEAKRRTAATYGRCNSILGTAPVVLRLGRASPQRYDRLQS